MMNSTDIHDLMEGDPTPGIAWGEVEETRKMADRDSKHFWKQRGRPNGIPEEFNPCGKDELDIAAYNASKGF